MNYMELIQNIRPQVSTGNPPRKEQDPPSIVRFDHECPLCKILAQFMQQRVSIENIKFMPSETPNPDRLMVSACEGGVYAEYSGVQAWQWLLERHPTFKEINWVAQRLGIASGSASALVRSAARAILTENRTISSPHQSGLKKGNLAFFIAAR